MVIAKGRAASPIRPGYLIKAVLSGQQPLVEKVPEGYKETIVTEACATDIHITYMELIRRENSLRPKTDWLRGMTSESFAKFVRFAKLISLIEEVREEPMLYPPPTGHLYRVEKVGTEVSVAISTRKILRLTDNGKAETKAWGNLCRAWREAWPIPTVEAVPLPEIKVLRRPPKVPKKWEPLKAASRPSLRQFHMFLRHLRDLSKIGVEDEDVAKEVSRLSTCLGDWSVELDEMIDAEGEKKEPKVAQVKTWKHWRRQIDEASEALMDLDIDQCISIIEGLV